jgi:hypothetical protein
VVLLACFVAAHGHGVGEQAARSSSLLHAPGCLSGTAPGRHTTWLPAADAVLFVLQVNARLERVETKYGHSSSGDPAFPKLQWPPVSICPACWDSSSSSSRTSSKQSSVNSSQAQQQQEGAEQQQQQQQQQQQPRWKEQQVLQFLEAWYANPASGAGPLWAALQGGNTGLARPLLLGKDTGLGAGEVAPSRGGMAPGSQLVLLAGVVMVFGVGWSWYKRRQVTSVRPRHYVGIVGHGGRLQSGPTGKYASNGGSRW